MMKRKYLVIALVTSVMVTNLYNSVCVNATEAVAAPEIPAGGKILEEKYKQEKVTTEELEEMSLKEDITPEEQNAIFCLNDDFGELNTDTKNPEYYAGLYLNEDKEIVVNVTSKKESIVNQIQDSANSEDVTIQKMNYIRNYITDGNKIIFENTKYDNVEATNLSAGQGIYTDTQNGRCGVYSIGFRVV